ncbi:MAG: hypothetical protein ED557_12615 [Balneola sp.]|nr:MAG: hypothetical protein ED557_12615 [Balneola sp.]
MSKIVWLVTILIFVPTDFVFAQSSRPKAIRLQEYKRIDQPARNEVSGMVKSRTFDDTFWVHGDSGTKDRIFAIDFEGRIKSDDDDYEGAKLLGVDNEDWEDIAFFDDSTLIVADVGNNCHCREDLKLLLIKEPDPNDPEVSVRESYWIQYPKRTGLLGLFIEDNYNSEAVFTLDGQIHLIQKNEGGGEAGIFVLENPSIDSVNILTKVGSFPFRGQVTAADISEDESMLAVLTYRSVWLFKLSEKNLFEGDIFWVPIRGVEQVESIAFSGNSLIIAEENGDLYELPISDIPEYKN